MLLSRLLVAGTSVFEICCVKICTGEVFAKLEHPITLEKSSANILSIQDKLSRKHLTLQKCNFSTPIQFIADADVTRGTHISV